MRVKLIATLVTLVTFASLNHADAQFLHRSAVRAERNLGITLTGDSFFSADDIGLPLPGVQLTYNISPYMALEAKTSLLYSGTPLKGMSVNTVGIKGYFLKGRFSPYAYLRTGFAHTEQTLLNEKIAARFVGIGEAGGGLEFAGHSGLVLYLEAGPVTAFTSESIAIAGRASVGIGVRF
jgi:hypothetical protein